MKSAKIFIIAIIIACIALVLTDLAMGYNSQQVWQNLTQNLGYFPVLLIVGIVVYLIEGKFHVFSSLAKPKHSKTKERSEKQLTNDSSNEEQN